MYREEFLPIKNYEGLYEISNAGRVKSLKRKIKNSRGSGYRTIEEKILKLYFVGPGKNKYPAVGLCKNGKREIYKIHQLLMNHFKSNPDPEHLTDIDHIRGGDTTCNFETSLEWVTKSENIKRSYRRDGRKPFKLMLGRFGKDHNKSKAVFKIDRITGKFLAEYGSMHEAERQTGIKYQNINLCCKGKRKTSGGFIWKYKN